MRRALLGAVLMSLALTVAAAPDTDQLRQQAKALFEPIPEEPPKLDGNPRNPAKVELGKMLYFEPRLSGSQTISCNSCHRLNMGGDDGNETSPGHQFQKGPRNSPTVLNAVFNTAQFWDGRAEDLTDQAGGPLQNPIEMASSPERVVRTLESIPEYRQRFAAAFSDDDEPVSFANTRKAIAAYESTLLTPNAPFDRFLAGDDDALSAKQKEGLQLFMGKGCRGCHSGVNLGGNNYQPFGVVEKPGAEVLPRDDKGRFKVTKSASDEYVFKVPSLRNVELTRPYFHSGKVWSLSQAVAIMGESQLGQDLSDAEVDKMVAFLESLTGEQPQVTLPTLPPSTDDTPHPSFGDAGDGKVGH